MSDLRRCVDCQRDVAEDQVSWCHSENDPANGDYFCFACQAGQEHGHIKPCAVEQWLHHGQHVPDDDVFVIT